MRYFAVAWGLWLGSVLLLGGCGQAKVDPGSEVASATSADGASSDATSSKTTTRSSRELEKSENNLRQIGLALQHYHTAHNKLPPAGKIDSEAAKAKAQATSNGLSWRVHILPYLEQEELYRKFRLNEPWDSDHNRKLLDEMPVVYLTPGTASGRPMQTHYRVFVGDFRDPSSWTMFHATQPTTLQSVADGLSSTIMVAESDEAVPWTKPDEMPFTWTGPLPPVGKTLSPWLALMGDGSVRRLPRDLPQDMLRRLIAAADGYLIDWASLGAANSSNLFDPLPRPNQPR